MTTPSVLDEAALTEVGRDVEVSRAEVVDGVLHARLRRLGDDATVVIDRVPEGARLFLGGEEFPTTGRGTVTVDVPAGPARDLELVR